MVTWTAPEIARVREPFVADERQMLEGFLDFYRATLLHKCAGLDGEQLALRAVPPSNLSLLGLIRHMTNVERSWFRRRFAGESIDRLYATDDNEDADLDDVDPADAESAYAAFVAELDAVRAAIAGHGLDETFFHERYQLTMSLRWVCLHMIEEYARHCGHADLIRERVDGTIGH